MVLLPLTMTSVNVQMTIIYVANPNLVRLIIPLDIGRVTRYGYFIAKFWSFLESNDDIFGLFLTYFGQF